ncbi:MAG TPA: phage tail tape measure protein [Oscillospiraceae bacterium]|nr:phage tail tape measure protein [Oscillospiraceae bacterium]
MAKKSEIQIEFKVINAEFQKAMKEMSGEVTKLNREFKLEQEQLRLNGTEKQKLESRVKYLTDRYKLQQDEVKATKEHLDKARESFGENSKEVQTLENRLLEAQRKEAYFANELQVATKALAEQNDKFKQIGKSMQEFGKKMQDIGKKMTDMGKNLSTKVTLPIVGVGVAASKLGIDFEATMSEVQAVTNATGDELQALEGAAREAGATTNKSARDAADALKYMGLAGWDVADSQKALMPMLKLSSAGNMELGRTSDLVTDSMSALGLEIGDMDGYLDILAQTSRNSNTDIDKLSEAFVAVGGRLNLLGVPTNDAAVALGILGDNGIKGSEAGRGLNAVLTNLTAPTGKAQKALDELNISAFDSNGEFIGLEETFQLVKDATNGMTQEQQNMYYSMIAGKEHGKTFNAILGSLGDGWDSLSDDVANAEGALDEMYDTMTDNTAGAIDELKSGLEELGLKIYDNLQPTIESLIGIVQGLTDGFNNLSPEAQENIVKIGMMVAAIAPALVIGGKLIDTVGKTADRFGKLIPVIAKTGTFIAGLSAPVLIAVGVITALIAIGVALYKNWDTAMKWGRKLKDSVSTSFSNIKKSIADSIDAAKESVRIAIEKIKSFFKFEWSLPKLKMPHVKISGSFSLVPPRVPKFSIDWYKEGAIFTKPTLLSTTTGLKGVGEAGAEAVLPITKLAGLIKDIIKSDTNLSDAYAKTVAVLEVIVPVSLDGRQIAVATAPHMNVELGKIADRGRR